MLKQALVLQARPAALCALVLAMPLKPMTMEDWDEMMSCSQIPGRGWMGACIAWNNHEDKIAKEKAEQAAKDKEKYKRVSNDRSRSPKQNAGDSKNSK